MSQLSDAICKIRKALGTQAEAAEKLQVKQNTLSQYETGRVTPSFPVLMRLYIHAPHGPDRQFIHEYLTARMKTDHPAQVIEDIVIADSFLNITPQAETPHRRQDLERFAARSEER